MKGKYIVLEGHDATGKDTQAELLRRYFEKQGRKVTVYGESGRGLESTEKIREIILNKDYELDARSHTLLFTVNRLEQWLKLAQPTLDQGGVVIATRNWFSTLAFEGYGCGVDLKLIETVTRQFLPPRYFKPDLICILTLDAAERQRRLHVRDNKYSKDSFESRGDDFQSRVNDGYYEIIKNHHVPTLDATPDPQKIHEEIKKLLVD
jgi:dTMP kinase